MSSFVGATLVSDHAAFHFVSADAGGTGDILTHRLRHGELELGMLTEDSKFWIVLQFVLLLLTCSLRNVMGHIIPSVFVITNEHNCQCYISTG